MAAMSTKVESYQMDSCQEGDTMVEKLTISANSVILNDAKDIVLVNGVVDEALDVAKADICLDTEHKMSELQMTFENELNSYENDESSLKLNDALTDEQKIELKMVLSNYFSHEYLSKDKFLISQMDYDQFIPVSIVAGLEDVIRITQNLTTQNKLDAVVKTLQEIQCVQLSEGNSKVRGIIERSTLLLREIPKSVLEKDIREIFTNDGCPPILACEYAHNDSWYVHFGSEDDANRAYKFLRESEKLFMNKPILARFKGKSALTGSYIPLQSSEVAGPLPSPAAVPQVRNSSSSVIAVPYLQSGYTYSYPEQTLSYYPDFYPGLSLSYNAFSLATCPVVGPMNIFYPPGDQTTVEVINNRQRKSYNRGGLHHRSSRPDPRVYGNEHKQPPRFTRKRVESFTHACDEHHHSTTTASQPPMSPAESHLGVGQISPSAESSQITHNPLRYPQRRGTNRGGRNFRHQEGGGGGSNRRCHVSDGPKPFKLETSSFPPLSSCQMADSNHLNRTEAKTQAIEPTKTVASNRVDQSTTTDGDFENPGTVTNMPEKFSYAQIAKRSVKEDFVNRNDSTERPPNGAVVTTATTAFTETSDVNSSGSYSLKAKDNISPKERRGGKPRHRPSRPLDEEVPKETH